MPLTVINADHQSHVIHCPKDFEILFKMGYLPQLSFCDTKTQSRIERRCQRALNKEWITSRQKWLGHYYAQELRGLLPLDLTIAWIDPILGYGVFCNKEIPANTYIGEYTGILRKRQFFNRWKNLYCFDYNIGEGRRTSYVIDAQDFGNHTRFINHAFDANLEPVSIYEGGLVHVILYAKKRIPAGQQLCYDYGDDYWQKRKEPLTLR